MRGQQTPRIRIEPRRSGTDGDGAALLMHEYGLNLDEWQKMVLDSWLGTDAIGNYNATSCGLSVARQNGKNLCIEAREFYGLLINGEKILHTAHQVRTCKRAFRRLASMFTDKAHPEIIKAVKQIRYGIGEESIELNNGGSIEFTSRSRQAARGYDGISLVVFDEAQELQDEQIEAIMAVLSASATGTRQVIYTGTAPYLGCNGEVFRRFRQSCLLSADQDNNKSIWHEWSPDAESINDIDISDRKLWYECNPALGYRLTEDFTSEEMKTLSPDGFARERLNFWAKPSENVTEYAINPDAWEQCKSTDEKPDGKTAFGVKFTADGSGVVVAGAIKPKEGRSRITVLFIESTNRGISWLANWLNERYKKACCVVIDGKSGTDILIEKLRPIGGGSWVFKDSIIKPTAQNVIAAASGLVNDINENAVSWYAEQDELNESALNATKRPFSGGYGFGGQNSAIIDACALALYGVKTCKRDPLKVMRLG